MKLRIDSSMAAAFNSSLEWWEEQRPDTWEGDVPEMSLEEIFRYFNRVDNSDVQRLEDLNYHLPSLSVGDIVTVDGTQYRVDPIGFKEIGLKEIA